MNKAYTVIFTAFLSTALMSMDIKKTHISLDEIKTMCGYIHHQIQKDGFNFFTKSICLSCMADII